MVTTSFVDSGWYPVTSPQLLLLPSVHSFAVSRLDYCSAIHESKNSRLVGFKMPRQESCER